MIHGGDLNEACARYGIAAENWLDLSTGINPNPYPLPPFPSDVCTRLPDAGSLRDLELVARLAYGVPPEAGVLAAPGTQALIQILPRLRRIGRVRIQGPTYSEHAKAWRANGHEVVEDDTDDTGQVSAVVVVNPNNPDGAVQTPGDLLKSADSLRGHNGLLVIDEAFADVRPEFGFVPHAGHSNVLILRSFGKFFGLAGLRLGFAIGATEQIDRLRTMLGPWAVSGPAIAAGETALGDVEWIVRTRARLRADAARLDRLLMAHGLRIVGGTSLFRLASTPSAGSLHEGLARQGIWVRCFSYAPDWLRFGLPADDAQFERLGSALARLSPSARKAG